jgi:drug/metabolite transporter (DMT)-like permease
MFTKSDIEKYFVAEKQESLLFLFIGLIAIITAIAFFFFLKTNFCKGAAVPLVVIGIIQFSVGFTIYKRSDADRIRNVYSFDMDPGELEQRELPRMEKVIKNFVIYRWCEVGLILIGILLILMFRLNTGKSFFFGMGIALVLQAFLMLGADYFAERRAHEYTSRLRSFFSK